MQSSALASKERTYYFDPTFNHERTSDSIIASGGVIEQNRL